MKSPNLWHGLLFLHGHVADAGLARSLTREPDPASSPRRSVFDRVLYPGGRPMHAGQTFDSDAPLAAPRIARADEHGRSVAC